MISFKIERPLEWQKDTYTIGKLYINYGDDKGYQFFSNTLEDKVRDLNHDGIDEEIVRGETAIPFGVYKITLDYSPSFKRTMPYLHGIKGFSGVMIHIGNTAVDTKGCILVGINNVKGKITSSTITFNKLYKIMEDSKQTEFTIEIV